MIIKSPSFPVLSLRIRAYLIDLLSLTFLVYFASFVVSFLGDFSGTIKGIAFVAVIVLFEPVLIKFTGGSLGHHYVGIRIANAKTHENLGFFQGVLRFILKVMLGFFSFFGMLITQQHRALHDALSGSVVLFKDKESAPEWQKLKPREKYADGEKPPLQRRLLVFISYGAIIYVALDWFSYAIISSDCLLNGICDAADGFKAIGIFAIIFVSLTVVLVLAIKGKLYGASYK